jgi:hypothetical protein
MNNSLTKVSLLLRICMAVVALIAAWGWGWGYLWASAWIFGPLWNYGAISVWLMLVIVFLVPKAWFGHWPTTGFMILLGAGAAAYLAGALALPDRAPVTPDVMDFVLVILGEGRIILAAMAKVRPRASENKLS